MHQPRTRSCVDRRGSVYLLVLLAITTCSAMLIAALEIVQANHRNAESTNDFLQASANADAGLEMAVRELETTPDWRWSLGDGAWWTGLAMPDGGEVTVEVTGASGSLSTDARDSAVITAIGTHGDARAITRVQIGLIPGGGPAVTGPSSGAYKLLAWWPLDGSDSRWCDEAIDSVSGTDEKYGAGKTYPGAVPAPGIATAPWFWGGSSASLESKSTNLSVRTISFWFYAESTTSLQYILEREYLRNSAGEWAFFLSGGSLNAEYVGPTATVAATSTPVSAGRWHHAVLVAGDTRVELYLDGAAVDAAPAPGSKYWIGTALAPVRVSGLVSGFTGFLGPFTGAVYDVQIFELPMSATDVAALYAAYPPPGQYRALADSFSRDVR